MISSKLFSNLQQITERVRNYISGTYSEHYTGDDNDIQTIDFIESLGTATSTFRDNAIKYLARYGKKNGKNEKDLLKAMHYIYLMLEINHSSDEKQTKGLTPPSNPV